MSEPKSPDMSPKPKVQRVRDAHAPDGITLKATAEITDYWALGRYVAAAMSDEQALFLHGLMEGFLEMPTTSRGRRLSWIAEAARDNQTDLGELTLMLADYLGDGR